VYSLAFFGVVWLQCGRTKMFRRKTHFIAMNTLIVGQAHYVSWPRLRCRKSHVTVWQVFNTKCSLNFYLQAGTRQSHLFVNCPVCNVSLLKWQFVTNRAMKCGVYKFTSVENRHGRILRYWRNSPLDVLFCCLVLMHLHGRTDVNDDRCAEACC
jgi:hypothetical protein